MTIHPLLLRGVFWATLAFSVIMAVIPYPPHIPIDNLGDKFEHALAFAVMALLGAIAYPRFPVTRMAERLSFLGAMIELIQSIPSLHRDCDIADWVTDTVSILLVLCLVALVRRMRAAGPGART